MNATTRTMIALFSVLAATVVFGYEIKHPNLKDAYLAADTAIKHIEAAQAANKGVEFGGHADKAIAALRAAQQELMAGDQYNDMHRK